MRIHRHRVRKPKFETPEYHANDKITADLLFVIQEGGESLGEMSRADALKKAVELGKDLVVVSPKANPPVAKLIDFGHFKYQKEKEARKQRAQSHDVDLKGVRLSARIGAHDLDIRYAQAKKFLERGDKIKVEVILRGREKSHGDLAMNIIEGFLKRLKDDMPLRMEQEPKRQGNAVTAILGR